jgi:hypothetical protein
MLGNLFGRVARLLSRRETFFALLCLCAGLYWAGLLAVDRKVTSGHVIGSDGLFYYEYLPSLVLDGDLDFSNQRAALIKEGVRYPWDHAILKVTPVGRPGTPFSAGWALFTAPFFLFAHVVAKVQSLWVPGVRLDGYGFWHESWTNFGALMWGLSGCVLSYRTLRLYFSERTASLAASLMLLGSNLLYYVVVQASMSHAVAFAAIAGATHYACRLMQGGGRSERLAAKFGLFCGAAFLVRPQLAVTVMLLWVLVAWQRPQPGVLARSVLFMLPPVLLQLFIWHVLFGTWLTIPQGQEFMHWTQPQVSHTLFGLYHGLFTWHPVYLVCLVGLAALLQPARHRLLALVALLCFAIQTYLNAAADDWWGGTAFGARRFVDIIPLMSLGAAVVIERLRSTRLAVVLVSVFAVWNVLFIVQYRFGYIPRGEAISVQQLTLDKFRLASLPRVY